MDNNKYPEQDFDHQDAVQYPPEPETEETPVAKKETGKEEDYEFDYLSTMEPVILIDKSRNKEAHLITSTLNNFSDLMESAKRINTGLFDGVWDLCYLDPETNKPVYVDEEIEIGSILKHDINTFYWKYKKPAYAKIPTESDQLNKRYRRESKKWTSNPRKSRTQSKTRKNTATRSRKPSANLQLLEYAYMGKRAMAWAIDAVILMSIIAVFELNPMAFIVWWLYFALLESSGYQATVGKMFMGLKVTDLNGQKLSFFHATIRHFGKWLSSITLGLGYAMAGFTEKKQALHDLIGGTIVLEVKPHLPSQTPKRKVTYTAPKENPQRTYYIRIKKNKR